MNAPMYCPFCADEDLWPQAEPVGAWRCRGCTRAFVVKRVRSTTEQPIGQPTPIDRLADALSPRPQDPASTQENS